jgi:hypothetical protein
MNYIDQMLAEASSSSKISAAMRKETETAYRLLDVSAHLAETVRRYLDGSERRSHADPQGPIRAALEAYDYANKVHGEALNVWEALVDAVEAEDDAKEASDQ